MATFIRTIRRRHHGYFGQDRYDYEGVVVGNFMAVMFEEEKTNQWIWRRWPFTSYATTVSIVWRYPRQNQGVAKVCRVINTLQQYFSLVGSTS